MRNNLTAENNGRPHSLPVQTQVIIRPSFTVLDAILALHQQGKKKTGPRRKQATEMTSARTRNILLISLLVPLIIGVGIWGGWFGPLEMATCSARGGEVVGDYGSGAV